MLTKSQTPWGNLVLFLLLFTESSRQWGDRNSPHFADEDNWSFEKLSNLFRTTTLPSGQWWPRASSQRALAPSPCAHRGCLSQYLSLQGTTTSQEREGAAMSHTAPADWSCPWSLNFPLMEQQNYLCAFLSACLSVPLSHPPCIRAHEYHFLPILPPLFLYSKQRNWGSQS